MPAIERPNTSSGSTRTAPSADAITCRAIDGRRQYVRTADDRPTGSTTWGGSDAVSGTLA